MKSKTRTCPSSWSDPARSETRTLLMLSIKPSVGMTTALNRKYLMMRSNNRSPIIQILQPQTRARTAKQKKTMTIWKMESKLEIPMTLMSTASVRKLSPNTGAAIDRPQGTAVGTEVMRHPGPEHLPIMAPIATADQLKLARSASPPRQLKAKSQMVSLTALRISTETGTNISAAEEEAPGRPPENKKKPSNARPGTATKSKQ